MKWYLKAWKNYANFSGRARRTEYWMFALFNILAAAIALYLDNVLGLPMLVGNELYPYNFYGPLYACYAVAALIPGLAVTVRRLHDTGNSGAMIFISLIPVIGGIWLLVLLLTDSKYGPNKYGENPKMAMA
ncbi:DUF805 domain-containing protein [Albibacterium indicum]|uniref:DUF805 domain-containing protein n=1 Tax=Albibacterium indicum TaxID=2292082 RepID=UPI000E49E371|nr:DUF805 domain-containing protein [Pedobacter indicus]